MSFVSKGPFNAASLAAEWRERISKIARNLTDFNDSEAAVRVKARMSDPTSAYRGRTAEAAGEALAALDALWRDYLMLTGVVDQADALAQKSGILSNHAGEVVALLTGASIKLPSVSVPVQQRGLLDSPEHQDRVKPQTVLDSMIKAFDVARSTIAAIDSAEQTIGVRTAALHAALKDIAGWSAANGVPLGDAPSIEGVERDPLASLASLEAAEAAVAKLKSKRDEAARELATLDKRLAEAGAALEALKAAIAKVKASAEDCAKRFEDGAPALDGSIETAACELTTWLETLRTARAAGRAKPAAIGLDKWEALRLTQLRAAESVAAQAQALFVAHTDLVGRLGALRAKGQALAARRPAAPELAALENEAKTEVRRTPCRMARAAAAIKAYEDALARA